MTELVTPPSLNDIRETAHRLAPHVVRTPVSELRDDLARRLLGPDGHLFLKLEFLQRTGTFKARGALNTLMTQDIASAGVTAVSAGNHAIAVAFAAKTTGHHAKVVLIGTANPARRAALQTYGAQVVISDTPAAAFDEVDAIVEREGRTLIHPFEGPSITAASATVGLEFLEDTDGLDAVIVAIGGGGLSSGVGAAIKQSLPSCAVYGVEPEGAANMRRSFDQGAPASVNEVKTIADSLGPPRSLPYSYGVCRQVLDDIVLVSDDEIAAACVLLFRHAKLALEPAAAAGLAAACGPLRDRLQGKRVGLILCGSNIDWTTVRTVMDRGEKALAAGLLRV